LNLKINRSLYRADDDDSLEHNKQSEKPFVKEASRLYGELIEKKTPYDKPDSATYGSFKNRFLEFAKQFRLEEIGNLRMAWEWAIAHEKFDSIGQALRSFGWLFELTGWLCEGIDQLESVVKAIRSRPAEEERLKMLGEALTQQGLLSLRWGRFDRALALFATHYFELTALPSEIAGCANLHFDAVEHANGIVFLHAAADGPANRSYGLQVARLAGVPADAIRRAKGYLARLDKFNAGATTQADLFAPLGAPVGQPLDASAGESESAAVPASEVSAILKQLESLDPDAMSPRDALAALYELRKLAGR
jgi:hypothetical protein